MKMICDSCNEMKSDAYYYVLFTGFGSTDPSGNINEYWKNSNQCKACHDNFLKTAGDIAGKKFKSIHDLSKTIKKAIEDDNTIYRAGTYLPCPSNSNPQWCRDIINIFLNN